MVLARQEYREPVTAADDPGFEHRFVGFEYKLRPVRLPPGCLETAKKSIFESDHSAENRLDSTFWRREEEIGPIEVVTAIALASQ